MTNKQIWKDWTWQQKNAIKDVRSLLDHFPNLNSDFLDKIHKESKRIKFQITPYILSKIPGDISKEDFLKNPWVKQFFPQGEIYTEGSDAYDGTDNWEKPEEFPTSNIQHKYDNRVLVRFRNCFGYCNFCFEALGVLEKNPEKRKKFISTDWEKSLDYMKKHPKVEEVILSGGEPLLNSDSRLEKILGDISKINDKNGNPKIKFKRVHTRALTINPYRITDSLVKLIKDYRVNEIALNVAHPSELTPEFEEAVGKIREGSGKYAPLLVLHTPLLKGINDNTEILWELFGKSYGMNIKPYYLLHSMPHTPFGDKQRVSVKDGVKLLKPLWRTKSHVALPEYIIVHYDGKRTVPLELNGTPEFQYTKNSTGDSIVRFKNWKNNWVEYPDVKDTIN